jgi:hypothetical protein
MSELVTSKITKVLSHCLILRPCNNGLDVIGIAVLEDVFFHDQTKNEIRAASELQ